jgi:hypothetical protein
MIFACALLFAISVVLLSSGDDIVILHADARMQSQEMTAAR